MSEWNPYAPPGSAVRDPAPPARGPRPRAVLYGVALLLVDLPLSLPISMAQPQMGPIWWVVSLVAAGWLYSAIWRGRNWARVTITVLTALAAVLDFAFPGESGVTTAALRVLRIAMLVVEFAAVYFLFRPDSSAWFRPRPAAS